jgi:hypothetical protein
MKLQESQEFIKPWWRCPMTPSPCAGRPAPLCKSEDDRNIRVSKPEEIVSHSILQMPDDQDWVLK